MSDVLIAARNLSLDVPDTAARPTFGAAPRRPVLQGLNFDVPRGSVLGVLGQAGAGKTVLARVLLRILDPSAGTLIFDGADITKTRGADLTSFRAQAQMIFPRSRDALNPRLNGTALIAAPLRRSLPRAEALWRAEAALASVGLAKEYGARFPHEMSDAALLRIAIARAIAPRPTFVLADAPGDGLALSDRARVLTLIEDLQRDLGLTMMVLSRDPSVIRRLSDRTMVLEAGQIVEDAPTPALFARASHPHSRALIEAVPLPLADQIW